MNRFPLYSVLLAASIAVRTHPVITPPAQDPEELFDVVTADGKPTGITKRRVDVHRDGDWHRSLHIWVYGVQNDDAFILMNQRGLGKDTQPGLLDPTVGGHLGAGETVEEAYREMEEEIGILPDVSRLHHIGTRPRAAEHTTPGVIDRELQEVFLYRDDRPLTAYQPNPAELESLIQISLTTARRFFANEAETVTAIRLDAHDGSISTITVTRDLVAPIQNDRYFLRVVLAIERVLRGDHYVLV